MQAHSRTLRYMPYNALSAATAAKVNAEGLFDFPFVAGLFIHAAKPRATCVTLSLSLSLGALVRILRFRLRSACAIRYLWSCLLADTV